MKAKDRKDFYVTPFERKGTKVKEELWAVRVGRGNRFIHSICRRKDQADEFARLLNLDPYIFERQDWKNFTDARK